MNKLIAFIAFLSGLSSVGAVTKGVMDIEEATSFLSSKTHLPDGFENDMDLSQVSPSQAIACSDNMFKVGLPYFLEDKIQEYTQDYQVLRTATHMAMLFKVGQLMLPPYKRSPQTELIQRVDDIYTLILDNFCWRNGHATETDAVAVAGILIMRERLINIQHLWMDPSYHGA